MKFRPLVALLLLISSTAHADDFVRARGDQLYLGDAPFRFTGANVEIMHGPAARASTEAVLDAAQKDGFSAVRVWALGEDVAEAPPGLRRDWLFRAGPDGWIDDAFRHLDRVLVAARARKLRVLVTLSNQWPDYGGAPMYVRWTGANARFYSDDRTRAYFRAHVARIVERTNSLSGVAYRDDPTILGWELMNESQADGSENEAERLAWITEMASFIKVRDPNHLVDAGVFGYLTRRQRAAWLTACRVPDVDVCDSHFYAQTTDAAPTLARIHDLLDDRAQLARFVARKPLIVGEFGFLTNAPADLARAGRFAHTLARLSADGAAGAFAWIYQTWSGRARDFGIYVDRPDTDDVRAALRRGFPPTDANARLGPTHGDTPLYDTQVALQQKCAEPLVDDSATIDPHAFCSARFERAGAWDRGTLPHVYGDGDGHFTYRFRTRRVLRRVTLTLQASSEFPGEHAPPDGTSRIEALVDDRRVAVFTAIPDDGRGRVERFELKTLRPGLHTLTLRVPPGPHARGLCLYGLITLAAR